MADFGVTITGLVKEGSHVGILREDGPPRRASAGKGAPLATKINVIPSPPSNHSYFQCFCRKISFFSKRGSRPLEVPHMQGYLLFDRRVPIRDAAFRPNTDVFRRGNDLIIRLEIPGLREGDYYIFAGKRVIEVHGNRIDYACKDGFYQMEIPFGAFRSVVEIPPEVIIDEKRVTAWYENGFLHIRCPKQRERKVPIQLASTKE